MADLQTNLQRLENNSDEILSLVSDISDAIAAKGGTVPANTGLRGFANAINSIPSGGGGSSNDAVRFIDYDGTVVQSYSAADFANLSALPANPSHTGLTAQGWNWTLSDAKTHVNSYGELDIGQMYVTDDERTRIYITLPENFTTPMFKLYIQKNTVVDVDWGDGSEHSTLTYTTGSSAYSMIGERHTYATPGNYVISYKVTTGTAVIRGSTYSQILSDDNSTMASGDMVYMSAIKKVELGSSVLLGQYAFCYCINLESITMPNDTVINSTSEYHQFKNCELLQHITFPTSFTYIPQTSFEYCYDLKSISFSNTITELKPNSSFEDCFNLKRITLPSSLLTIGKRSFYRCSTITKVVMPNSVTTIGEGAFSYCDNLTSIVLSNAISTCGSAVFQYCKSLTDITIPEGNTLLGSYMFADCYALKEVLLPSTLTTLGTYCFQNCYLLEKINIPSLVDTIPGNCFNSCRNLIINTIPSTVTKIDSSAFTKCDSLAAVVPSSVTSVGGSAFSDCIKISEATLYSTTTYGQSVFSGCYNIIKATIEEGVTELSQGIFSSCAGITDLVIPSTVTKINSSALNSCRSLKTLKFIPTSPPTVTASSVFSNLPTTCKILVPTGTLSTYTSMQYYPNSSTYTYEEY